MEYLLHIIIMVNIYVLLALSANLPVGMANLLSICLGGVLWARCVFQRVVSTSISASVCRRGCHSHAPRQAVERLGFVCTPLITSSTPLKSEKITLALLPVRRDF
jgi:hypothetical protein